jgi:phosphoribosyl-AMP cyclohydrolase
LDAILIKVVLYHEGICCGIEAKHESISDFSGLVPQQEIPAFAGKDGLITAIVQDAQSGEVLMCAYVNSAAWQKTQVTGEVWFWSTSRQKLWHKGETSGNTMAVDRIEVNGNLDAAVFAVRVKGNGLACHLGRRSCFSQPHREI